MHKGEDLRDEDVSHRMHDRVEHVVDENHRHYGTRRLVILRLGVVCAGSSPACEQQGHANECDEVLRPALQYLGQEGAGDAGDEIPAAVQRWVRLASKSCPW